MLCTSTYKLEGDGLEILLAHDILESIVQKGRMLGSDAADLPNLAALLRAKKKIEVGLPINEYYAAPDNDWYTGKVIRVAPNKWTVQYDVDKTVSEITDINHLRKYIHVTKLPQWQECVDKVKAGFKYLEQRLTDDCPAPYHCKEQHEALGLLRAFEPSFACANVDVAYARKLAALKPYAHLQCADALVQELPIYLAAARSEDATSGLVVKCPVKCI